MYDLINTTMIMSASDNNKGPLAFDRDSEKLTIIFGTFATLIALFGLVFAALTWYTPRRRLSAQPRASDERHLESNATQRAAPVVRDSPDTVDTESGYVRTTILRVPDVHKLTSSSNAGAPPSSLAIDPSPSDVDTIVPMPLRHQSLCEDHAVTQQDLSNNAGSVRPAMSAASSQENIHIVDLACNN
jgi:hypothetical protein